MTLRENDTVCCQCVLQRHLLPVGIAPELLCRCGEQIELSLQMRERRDHFLGVFVLVAERIVSRAEMPRRIEQRLDQDRAVLLPADDAVITDKADLMEWG